MLSFPTRVVSDGAVQVSGVLDPDDKVWIEGDDRPETPGVEVTGRVSVAGPGRFYFSGSLAGSVGRECGRCLAAFRSDVAADLHIMFTDGTNGDDDDADVFPVVQGRGGTEIDLRPAVREGWLLEQPAIAVCSPECKGLCVRCGTNLNQGACQCARKPEE